MKKIFLLFLFTLPAAAFAQTELVFVYFTGKPNKAAFYANPLTELTQKSLSRRAALGIALNDQDAPIETSYIQALQNLGFNITDKSKWLNGVALRVNQAQVNLIKAQPYVQSVESFAKTSSLILKAAHHDKWESFNKNQSVLTNFNYGNASDQIDQINLRPLHLAGFTGTGVAIAVIDTGFPTVDTGSAFLRIRNGNQIKAGYDFVTKTPNIYNPSLNSHGTVVLGAIGGFIQNSFAGSAPDADFYLYRSENAAVEVPEEEMYWIEAAEEADRQGVDIITSSLGYNVFDEPKYNYTYVQMNGTTSFIARGSQIAASRGIFVLVAAGNSGEQTWHYITTPADNAQVFSIGAVDDAGNASAFSSFGPNSAGVIKPDAAARGSMAATVDNNAVVNVSGTSISTPIAAGGVACLMQAFPAMNRELMKSKLRQTASLYPNTNPQTGYGILNFGSAYTSFLGTSENSFSKDLKIAPNPVKDFFSIISAQNIDSIEISDAAGRLIRTIKNCKTVDMRDFIPGTYYLKITSGKAVSFHKIIRE